MSIQEAVPLEDNPFLAQLFGPDVLGRLPTAGQDRIRRTMLGLIGMNTAYIFFWRLPNLVQGRIQHGSQPSQKHRHPPQLRLF